MMSGVGPKSPNWLSSSVFELILFNPNGDANVRTYNPTIKFPVVLYETQCDAGVTDLVQSSAHMSVCTPEAISKELVFFDTTEVWVEAFFHMT